LRREMGKHAHELILKKRSWDVRIEQDIAVYRRILAPNGRI
jgi:hypothetical protein